MKAIATEKQERQKIEQVNAVAVIKNAEQGQEIEKLKTENARLLDVVNALQDRLLFGWGLLARSGGNTLGVRGSKGNANSTIELMDTIWIVLNLFQN